MTLLQRIHCPQCQQPLASEYSSQLTCPQHGRFTVEAKIPMLSPLAHFESHWEDNAAGQIPPSKIAEAARFLFPITASLTKTSFAVLDAGCGDGAHAAALQRFCHANHIPLDFVGCDISMAALHKCQQHLPDFGQFVQCDVGQLPFANEQFDASFSFGVIGYTDHPANSFAELCRVTKPGGLVGIWIYPKRTDMLGRIFQWIRILCQQLGPTITNLLADCIVPFLPILPTRSKVSLFNASWQQCREVVLVNIQPEKLYFPTRDEVKAWFVQNHIQICHEDLSEPITLWGYKQ